MWILKGDKLAVLSTHWGNGYGGKCFEPICFMHIYVYMYIYNYFLQEFYLNKSSSRPGTSESGTGSLPDLWGNRTF